MRKQNFFFFLFAIFSARSAARLDSHSTMESCICICPTQVQLPKAKHVLIFSTDQSSELSGFAPFRSVSWRNYRIRLPRAKGHPRSEPLKPWLPPTLFLGEPKTELSFSYYMRDFFACCICPKTTYRAGSHCQPVIALRCQFHLGIFCTIYFQNHSPMNRAVTANCCADLSTVLVTLSVYNGISCIAFAVFQLPLAFTPPTHNPNASPPTTPPFFSMFILFNVLFGNLCSFWLF